MHTAPHPDEKIEIAFLFVAHFAVRQLANLACDLCRISVGMNALHLRRKGIPGGDVAELLDGDLTSVVKNLT